MITLAAALTLLVRVGGGRRPPLPLHEGTLLAASGIWSAAIVGYLMFDRPTAVFADFPTDYRLGYGIFVALGGAVLLALAGLRIRRDELARRAEAATARGRRRGIEPPLPHPLLDPLDHGPDHLHPGVALGVGGDHVPGSVRLVGAGEHVLDRLEVRGRLSRLRQSSSVSFQIFRGSLLAPLEAPHLLLLGDVQPELDQDHPLVGEGVLEGVDLVVGAQPLLAGGELLDPLDQSPARTRSGRRSPSLPSRGAPARSARGSGGASRRGSAPRTGRRGRGEGRAGRPAA